MEAATTDEAVVNGTGQEVVPAGAAAAPMVLGTDDPRQALERASDIANRLKEFVVAQDLVKRIGQSDHLEVGAWQMIGGMLTVTPVPGEPQRQILEDPSENTYDIGYVCTTELHDRTGRVIGKGTGRCFRSEATWAEAEEYALASMAETRSIGRAFRNVFVFIAKTAGYDPTPAEEMSGVPEGQRRQQRTSAGGTVARPARSAPKAKAAEPKKGDGNGAAVATQAQRRMIYAKFKEAGGEDDAYLRAVIKWVADVDHSDKLPKAKVDDVLEAIKNLSGTIEEIRAAAEDPDRPDGPDGRAIVDKYLGGGEQQTLEG